MKKFTQTTLIALLIGTFVFAQKGGPGNQAAPSQTTVIVGALRGSVILLSPADGKSIAASDASKPVLFRWTAVSPKPKEAVTYRLKVWQLMQGQNATEAMRSNQPIVTKDVVNITQAAISNLYTGPCRPPYLCDFVWAVEALVSDGILLNNSFSASSSFKFETENTEAAKVDADIKGNANNTGQSSGKSLKREKGTGMASGKSLEREKGTGMASGKSLNNLGNPASVISLNGLPPGQPIIVGGGIKAQGDPVHGVDIKLGMKKQDKELDKNQPNAKDVDKELDKNQPNAKSIDKELDKNQPNAKSQQSCIHCDHRLKKICSTHKKLLDKELDKNQPAKSIENKDGSIQADGVKPVIISERRRPSGDASWELYKVKFPCNCFWCQLKS